MSSGKRRVPQKEKDQIINLFKSNRVDEALIKLIALLDTHPSDHELHYLTGMIHGSQYRYVEAVESFEEAVRFNPKHGESHFELGLSHVAFCRFNKALARFQKAGKLNYNLKETNAYLQKIKKVAKPKDVTLSTCLIVKNEEKHLATCLKSVRAISDEIVVVDTGSEDRTVEIAQELGAKVFHYEWQKDFAAARNFANEQASSDWILQLDADEELFPEDQGKVRELIHQGKCNGAYLALHNRVSSTFGENQPSVHYLVRLYRNSGDCYFINPIHEVLQISGEVLPVDINILHHGYNLDRDYLDKKKERNAEILYKRLAENPESVTTLFYLCMMHVGKKEFDLAASFGKQALERIRADDVGKQHLYLMLLNNLALISVEKQDHEAAKQYCLEAIKINVNYLDPYYFLGVTYVQKQKPELAKETFQNYLKKHKEITSKPVFNLFASSSDTYLYQVYHFLGKIYRKEGESSRAKEMLLKSVKSNRRFWIGMVDLGYLCVDCKDYLAAADYFDRAIKIARKNPQVNEDNPLLWADFTNAVKAYARVLQELRSRQVA